MKILVVLSAIMVAATLTWGTPVDLQTGQLLRYCESANRIESGTPITGDAMIAGYCIGYLVGLTDGSLIGGKAPWCAPTIFQPNQLTRIFIKWANEHPELHHEHRIFGVGKALTSAWPCKGKSKY